MSIQKTEGFILRTYDFRETSKIVFFYTKEFGKIKGILKGVREDRQKFSTTLEPSSKNEIIFYEGEKSDLHLISRCDLIEDFSTFRKDLKKMVISNCFLELLDNIMPLEEKNIPIFNLLGFSLNALNKGFDPQMLWILFQIKTLKLTGFKPELRYCLLCQKDVDGFAYFSLRAGGLLCSECRKKDKDAKGLLKGTLASLLYIERIDLKRFCSFKLDTKIRNELKDLLKRFIEFHSEIKIKSERLMKPQLMER